MSTKLFDMFPPVSTEQWMEAVTKDLKGVDFEKRLVTKTLDGIPLKPFYRKEDVPANLPRPVEAVVDGNHWILREEIREPDLAAARRHANSCLHRGAQELAVLTYPIGPALWTPALMDDFLTEIRLDKTVIHWISGPLSVPTLALILGIADRHHIDASHLHGSIDLDPLMDRCAGWTGASIGSWRSDLIQAIEQINRFSPNYGLLTIRGSFIEKAGASLVQELAFSLALQSEYLTEIRQALVDGRLSRGDRSVLEALSNIVNRSELRLGIGAHYFLEIAKLRAARILQRNMLAAFEIENSMPKLHAVSTSSNKTLYDPYNNLLRGTVEATAAIIAGVDSLTVAAYDQGYDAPDEFSEHLARNTKTLLQLEAYMDKVRDPLGGSYTVESLTHSLCDAAWKLFQQIEEQGGFQEAWTNGFIPAELERIKAERAQLVSGRRRTIVGTTVYPDLKEHRLEDVHARPHVTQTTPLPSEWGLEVIGSPASYIGGGEIPSTPLDPFRPSWPYENIRLRTERHLVLGQKLPVVLLALVGDPTMSRARSKFCQGVFGAGGYDVREYVFRDPASIADKAEELGADVVVLCAKDEDYLALAQAVNTTVPLVVAGYPKDAIDDLKAAGVSDFIHIRQNLLETLETWHERFGIPSLPLDEPINPRKS